MVVTARRPFPSIAIWQQPNFNPHNFTYPLCCLSKRVCVILYMSLYFVEKKYVEAILVELVAVPKWPHNFLNCYSVSTVMTLRRLSSLRVRRLSSRLLSANETRDKNVPQIRRQECLRCKKGGTALFSNRHLQWLVMTCFGVADVINP